MPHNAYFKPPTTMGGLFVPTPAFIRRLDLDASQSLNGEDGGVWTPRKPIIVGGNGISIGGAGGFSGGIATAARSRAGALVLGDSDWPSFAARSRVVVFPILDDLYADRDVNQLTTTGLLTTYDQGTSGSFKAGAVDLATICFLDMKKFPIGATIDNVVVRFRVGTKPAAVPTLPIAVLTDETYLNDDNGSIPAPGTAAVYYNNGLPQSITITPVNNPTVVPGKTYSIKISDQAHTSNIYHSIAVTFTNILDMRPGL